MNKIAVGRIRKNETGSNIHSQRSAGSLKYLISESQKLSIPTIHNTHPNTHNKRNFVFPFRRSVFRLQATQIYKARVSVCFTKITQK